MGPQLLWVRKDVDHSLLALKAILYPFTALLIAVPLVKKKLDKLLIGKKGFFPSNFCWKKQKQKLKK